MQSLNGGDTARRLLGVMNKTGYPIVQHNGQRKFGPPPDWVGPPPPKGSEVFVGKLPRDILEDELVPIFSSVGKIYELRLMMDFSGSNRGYAFVTYATKEEASAAVRELNHYEIQPRKHIGVVKSVDNCRLFIGNLPKDKTKEEVYKELSSRVSGIVNVILYRNCYEPKKNRGFAFVEFTSHRAAAMARRALVPGCVRLWDKDIVVDWAEPQPEIEDEQMKLVKVLYVRNFEIRTSPETITNLFETAIKAKIERVKKIYDYAFVHFFEREHAELAMAKLQNAEVDGINIEIQWAKPVDRDLYRIQKLGRGNAKFNTNLELSHTLLLYKQHLEKKEYDSSPKDEGIGSGCAPDSPCCSPTEHTALYQQDHYISPPAKLDSMCSRYMWAQPIYKYQKYFDPACNDLWVGVVELPHVGQPLLSQPRSLGPFITRACFSVQQAQLEAAILALNTLKMLRLDLIRRSTQTPHMYQPMVTTALPQTCLGVPCDYMNTHLYATPPPAIPVTIPTMW